MNNITSITAKDLKPILYEIKNEVYKVLGSSMEKFILYGSYARGDYNNESDVDIMVLTSLPDLELRNYRNRIVDIEVDVALKYDIDVSIYLKNRNHFYEYSGILPYYKNILNDGVIVDG